MSALRFVYRNKWTVFFTSLVFIAGAIALAESLTPMYRSDIVVSPVDSSSGLGQLAGQFGGLASMAGINLGGGGSKKSDEALEFLRSRSFCQTFIERHNLLPKLFPKQWDGTRNQWRDPKKAPTIEDGVIKFSKKVRQVSEDKRTGIVTLAIVWSDRVAAAEWANQLVAEADAAIRQRAIAQQARSLEYLQSEAAHTTSVEVTSAISKLMETELKNSMVARTRDAYAFNVIDPAVPSDPKYKDSPNKVLIVFLGAFVGMLVGLAIAGIREARPHSVKA